MNENLPEIGFKEKKEKKGFLPWLRARLGFGSRSGMGGVSPSAANFGKLGAAKFGASAGIGGLLAGKAGLLVTAAMVAVGTGVYIANNGPAPTQDSSSFNSSKAAPDTYVPAILRSQARAQSQGSSLDMFKDTNKNAGLLMENDAEKKAEAEAAAKRAQEEEAARKAQAENDQNQPQPDNNAMQQDMMGKLQGAAMGSLSGSLGEGSSKFSGMGGFGNKFGKGAVGPQVGLSNIGSGFQSMSKFDQRKKMLAMTGGKRAASSSAQGGRRGPIGRGSYNQAKGIKAMQRSLTGNAVNDADANRATQDRAWGESAADGAVSGGGTGVNTGGAGIVTSPSLDNTGNSGGGGGGGNVGNVNDPVIPDASNPTNVSPWAGLVSTMMTLLMLSAVLAVVGGAMVKSRVPWISAIGIIICGIAAALGAAVVVMGLMLMQQYGQAMLSMIYVAGGAMAIAGAMMSMAGGAATGIGSIFAKMTAAFNPLYMIGGAVAMGLIGSMMGGGPAPAAAGRETPSAQASNTTQPAAPGQLQRDVAAVRRYSNARIGSTP